MSLQLQPVILSGGAGTRLWPLSRRAFPKQFHALVDDSTLLQSTALRVAGLEDVEVLAPLVVCNEMHRFMVAEQLRECGRDAAAIMLEPVGRNTAPALTLAALQATSGGGDPLLLVMPADHVIRDQAAFETALHCGIDPAAQGRVVTFGIVPDAPHTGYGYIRRGEAEGEGAFQLEAFVEKPDLQTAESYLAQGNYLWNSGIFLLRASRWLELAERFCPQILQAVRQAHAHGQQDMDFFRADEAEFQASIEDVLSIFDQSIQPGKVATYFDVVGIEPAWTAGNPGRPFGRQ